MRSVYSVKNAIFAMISNIVTILIGLVSQAVFLKTLGTEYLGVNGLFSNILSMLGIIELGIGSAIIYNLYRPIAEGNKEKIKSLMNFYKKSYRIIALVVSLIGLSIIPFLGSIVGEVSIKENIVYIYILCLIDVVASYLLSYKRSILYASQKTYITNIIHIGYLFVMNLLQIIILLLTKNYILYLSIKIICRIVENIVITYIANKMYPYIKEKNVEEIDQNTKTDIITKVKGLIFHKIGSFIVLGTDNIIISKFLGVVTVGLYSNYNLIIQAVSNLFSQIFDSITASVGNLLVEDNVQKSYRIYKNMLMVNSWIFTFATAAIICLITPFIKIWIGEQYLLENSVLVVLMINFYIQGMRKTNLTFKGAAGIFHEDRFFPLIESVVNIIASIFFLHFFGLAGVFLGTITSSLVFVLGSYPIYMYIPIFKRKYMEYIKDNFYYYIIAFVIVLITVCIVHFIVVDNVFIQLIINGIVVLIVPNVLQFILFRKKEEFKYILEIFTNLISRRKERANG